MSQTAPTPVPTKKPIYKRVWFWLAALALVILMIVGGCAALVGSALSATGPTASPSISATSESEQTAEAPAAEESPSEQAPAPEPTESAPDPAPAEDVDSLSPAQAGAASKAEEYLGFSSFSRTGLIAQLEFEKFSTADATAGVDSLDIDYDEQAVKKGAEYLDFTSFSRDGLIDQLTFDGFTPEQAAAGADATGL